MRPLVVVGDSLLDTDLSGRADRLTPDAPAPVLEDLVERSRPGGAGLAALLASRSGRETVLVTAWGDDAAGARLESLLRHHVSVVRVPGGGSTPVKRRVRARGHTLLRLDSGGSPGVLGDAEADLGSLLRQASGVLVADYGRGIAAHPQVRRALTEAGRVPVVWDPHRQGARAVPGVRLLTPNDTELEALQSSPEDADDADRAAGLAAAWRAEAVAVTLGERGALLVTPGGVPSFHPATAVAATDTCGAGDRFAATALVRLAAGALTSEAVADAVAEAAEFVATGAAGSVGSDDRWPGTPTDGAAPASRVRGLVATGGCFDLLHAGHVACLEAARSLGDRLVVCLNSDASVSRLKGPGRPVVPQADRARVLRALACVDDVVVFDEDTPVEVLRRLRPDVWAKGGDYDESSLPEASVLSEWGGRTVVLPYLSGRSTTDLVRAAGERSSR
jgi:D-beta-D-heptose 7-phosphate kinase / D-beta-D-heptose 1-phosphate adenosyltransferase